MEKVYNEVIDYIVSSGKRIVKQAGKLKDIGKKKQWLTKEDIAIERGMRDIIKKHCPKHEFYAEEENEDFSKAKDIWVADPISGTKTFIQGLPHYGIAIAHTKNNAGLFAAVYDPSVNELFTAFKGKGAFLNGKKISVSKNKSKIIFNLSYAWKDEKSGNQMSEELETFKTSRNKNSHAVNLCYVACGRYDGTVSFCKDSFPMFAGSVLIQEAGGILTNSKGQSNFSHKDRVFIGGNKETYKKLMKALSKVKLLENVR